MTRRSWLAPIALALFVFSARAEARAGWTDYAQLVELVASSKHFYSFRLELDNNPSGCRDDQWFYQDYSAPGADKIYETLLRALTDKLSMRVYVTGVCNLDGYAEISSLSIIP